MNKLFARIRRIFGFEPEFTLDDLEQEMRRQIHDMFEGGTKVKLFSIAKSGPWWMVGIKVNGRWEMVDRYALAESAIKACERLPDSTGIIRQRRRGI
jgi:hypothetical protein